MKPRVSIGLCVYNGQKFLPETLDSFLAQTYGDFELIICDNASTDGTGDIARRYAALDSRIRYHRNSTNIGLGRNHNRAFELAQGQYFKWAASDDCLCPAYLERCVAVLGSNPDVVLAYPKTIFINAEGRKLDIEDPGWNLRSEQVQERLRFCLYAGHWANAVVGVIRREALAQTRLFPTYPGGDFRVLTELSVLGKFYEVPEYLFQRRLHPGSSRQNRDNRRWILRYWQASEKAAWPFWSLSRDRFWVIWHTRLPFAQKVSLSKSLLQAMYWGHARLWDEFKEGCADVLAHWFRRNKGRAELECPPSPQP